MDSVRFSPWVRMILRLNRELNTNRNHLGHYRRRWNALPKLIPVGGSSLPNSNGPLWAEISVDYTRFTLSRREKTTIRCCCRYKCVLILSFLQRALKGTERRRRRRSEATKVSSMKKSHNGHRKWSFSGTVNCTQSLKKRGNWIGLDDV